MPCALPCPAEDLSDAAFSCMKEDPSTSTVASAAASAIASAPPATATLDAERQRTFALLQPICSLLLLQRAEPQRMAELLTGDR
jgi:hypothetical protein